MGMPRAEVLRRAMRGLSARCMYSRIAAHPVTSNGPADVNGPGGAAWVWLSLHHQPPAHPSRYLVALQRCSGAAQWLVSMGSAASQQWEWKRPSTALANPSSKLATATTKQSSTRLNAAHSHLVPPPSTTAHPGPSSPPWPTTTNTTARRAHDPSVCFSRARARFLSPNATANLTCKQAPSPTMDPPRCNGCAAASRATRTSCTRRSSAPAQATSWTWPRPPPASPTPPNPYTQRTIRCTLSSRPANKDATACKFICSMPGPHARMNRLMASV